VSSPPGPSHAAKVVADPEGCTGAGTCALTAPEVFDQDDDRRGRLLAAGVPGVGVERARRSGGEQPVGGAMRGR
jgi:ferredoxin